MAHDKIKLNYEQADHMAKTFKSGAQKLEQTMHEMQTIAQMLQEGALLGDGGNAFVEALNSKLCPSIKRMTDKFNELERDVHAAINYMKQADAESKQQFN